MQTIIATNMLSSNFIQALSNTLLHSLWQGVVLAMASGLIMMLTYRAKPAIRYQLLLAVLVLFTAGIGATFLIELKVSAPHINKIPEIIALNSSASAAAPMESPVIQHKNSWVNELLNFLNLHSRQLVVVWALMVCMRSFQLLSDLQGIQRLKRSAINLPDPFWQQQVNIVAHRLAINKLITIAESGLAKVPMIIGHLKPVILIPVGLLSSLSAAEIEAIILHELAHIRRRDYLVNLLQSLLEVLLFFNPAVLWVSALLRTERENCCDDLVIDHTGNRINYIKALLACQQQQLSPALAMASAGKGGSLLNRVNRMVSGRNTVLNQLERGVLIIVLLIVGLGSIAFTPPQLLQHLASDGNIKQPIIQSQSRLRLSKTNAVRKKITAPVTGISSNKEITMADSLQKEADLQQQQINADAMRMEADSIAQTAKQHLNNYPTYPKNNYKSYTAGYNPNVNDYHSKTDTTKHLKISTNINLPVPIVVQPTPHVPVNNPANKSNNRTDAIISDMMSDGIIAGRNGLSFKIGIKEFIVNGKKQSDAVFNKYRNNYVKDVKTGDDWSWYYNYDPASGHTTETTSTTTNN